MDVRQARAFPRVLPAVCVVALVLAAVPATGSPTYSVTDLGTLPGGDSYTPLAINASGSIVGLYGGPALPASPTGHAFLYTNGQLTDITASGANGRGINASGTMTVGNEFVINDSGATISYTTGVPDSFVLKQGGSSTSFPAGFMPEAMNDQGLIVGSTETGAVSAPRAALYSNGNLTLIGPQGSFSEAGAVNNAGHIVGVGPLFIGSGFYFDGSRMLNIGALPGGEGATPFAINDHDQIVGNADVGKDATGNLVLHAFLSVGGGRLLDLNTLIPLGSGWVLDTATAINDSGAIVGYGTQDGRQAAFELVPTAQSVPEPTSLVFGAICLLSAAGRAILRKRHEA